MLARAPRWNSHDGYTLIEMIVVAALVIIGSVIAIPVTRKMVSDARGDSALSMTAAFLESARNRAVAERRNVELTFLTSSSMQLERIEVPDGTRTIVATLQLEGEAEFFRDLTLPDTDEATGGPAGTAFNFTGAVPVMFTSDGSLIDSAGDVANGTIFIATPNSLETTRAVTISGVTGLLRTWK